MDTAKLKGKIIAAGYTQKTLSEVLKMKVNTLNRKINGRSQWTLDEIARLCEALGLSESREKVEIFLD